RGDALFEPLRRAPGGRASIGNAIGNAYAAEAAASDEQTGMSPECAIYLRNPLQMSDLVLRVATVEAVDTGEERIAGDSDQRMERAYRQRDQLLVGAVERPRIARAADKRAQQHVIVVRRAMRPFRRQPRRGEESGVLDLRHDEAGSVQGV